MYLTVSSVLITLKTVPIATRVAIVIVATRIPLEKSRF